MAEEASYTLTILLLIAFSSGLFGSIITVVCEYFFNKRIAIRENQRRTKELCFLYMVRLSDYLAIEAVIRGYIQAEIERRGAGNAVEHIEQFFEKGGLDFSFLHEFTLLLIEDLKLIAKENPDSLKRWNRLMRSLQEDFSFEIEDELLISLPHEAIAEYSRFTSLMRSARETVSFWLDFTENPDIDLLIPVLIFGQWEGILRLFESAKKLRKVLIAKGNIELEEAKEVLSRQIHWNNNFVWSFWQDKQRLEQASKHIDKQIELLSLKRT